MTKKFVLLEGIKLGNRFYSTFREGEDPTKSDDGQTWYRILGYADTPEEAQLKLYTDLFPTGDSSSDSTRIASETLGALRQAQGDPRSENYEIRSRQVMAALGAIVALERTVDSHFQVLTDQLNDLRRQLGKLSDRVDDLDGQMAVLGSRIASLRAGRGC